DDPDQRYGDMYELLAALRDKPPSDEPAADDEAIDDELVEVVGRVLHKSIAGAAQKPSRATFLIALSLVFVVVLLGGLAETSLLVEQTEPEVEPAPLPAHPCAGIDGSDPMVTLDPVVYEVCGLIRDDHLNGATMLW